MVFKEFSLRFERGSKETIESLTQVITSSLVEIAAIYKSANSKVSSKKQLIKLALALIMGKFLSAVLVTHHPQNTLANAKIRMTTPPMIFSISVSSGISLTFIYESEKFHKRGVIPTSLVHV